MMRVHPVNIPGPLVVAAPAFPDDRGVLRVLFGPGASDRDTRDTGANRDADADLASALPTRFAQVIHSRSRHGVLRGLHYQARTPQAKLVYAITGEIYDVAVDVRTGSPTFARYAAIRLSADDPFGLFIPAGFAHGFYVLSETADVVYQCSTTYDPDGQRGVRWDDPQIGITWPRRSVPPVLSQRDRALPPLSEATDLLPYGGEDPGETP
jgi:dTDP-4-dehydrorhamnose 3,5-epimerase